MKIRSISLAAWAACALLAWPVASAADSPSEKAGRGVAAMMVPFLEIPGNIIETARRDGNAAAWTEGLARGIGMSFLRPPVGFYELVTAPFATPPKDRPVLSPEYPWSYFANERGDVAAR